MKLKQESENAKAKKLIGCLRKILILEIETHFIVALNEAETSVNDVITNIFWKMKLENSFDILYRKR